VFGLSSPLSEEAAQGIKNNFVELFSDTISELTSKKLQKA
jgi:hypothetical protein